MKEIKGYFSIDVKDIIRMNYICINEYKYNKI